MIIKSFELNNYCGISHLVCHFKSGVNIIDNADVLKAVYKVINGDFSESPDITAEITPHANQQINTRGSPNETKSFNIFVFSDTAVYSDYFNLYKHLDDLHKKEKLLKTDGIIATRFFRHRLNKYIKSFKPFAYPGKNGYKIILQSDGKFSAVNAENQPLIMNNKKEKAFFELMCFLKLREFWNDTEKAVNMNYEKRPFIISGLPKNYCRKLKESKLFDKEEQVFIATAQFGFF
ncbi:MAG TPA: hypothetical protein DCP17_02525 [Ruminococcaceae bacterium]|nr:hypothetical protein [Oscillospiraceae bacterium]